jgi:outer membrane biosynthesis protein TonB
MEVVMAKKDKKEKKDKGPSLKQLQAAAEDLNETLGLDPEIETDQDKEDLIEALKEAGEQLEADDEISDETREVLTAIGVELPEAEEAEEEEEEKPAKKADKKADKKSKKKDEDEEEEEASDESDDEESDESSDEEEEEAPKSKKDKKADKGGKKDKEEKKTKNRGSEGKPSPYATILDVICANIDLDRDKIRKILEKEHKLVQGDDYKATAFNTGYQSAHSIIKRLRASGLLKVGKK